jgi:glycosyltransferase involved in cell wall biosynthesis
VNERLALFLLPRPLDGFILADFVRPLIEAPGVAVLEPGRVPAGALMRLPGPLAAAEATRQVNRVKLRGELAVVIAMHPVLQPLAAALLDRNPGAELWYGIWDRYDHAPDADHATRKRVHELHEALSRRADWRFAVSGALAEVERAAGRDAEVLPPPHDSFPAPDPSESVVAVSMGHLGRRTDWKLLADLLEAMPELTLLLIGDIHPDETPGDADLARAIAAPGSVVLGSLDDEAAARVISLADVGILPFKLDEFNDGGLPQRVLKAARVGRATLVPPLKGPLTQERAVKVCETLDDWTAALRSFATGSHKGDGELRQWALGQNEEALLAPIQERLRALGVEA